MSLINKKLINKYNGIVWGLSSFIPKEAADREYLFKIMYKYGINFTDEEKEILLDTVNVFNLFDMGKSYEGFEFWREVDKQQAEYIDSFNFDKSIYKKYELYNTSHTYLVNDMKTLLKKI